MDASHMGLWPRIEPAVVDQNRWNFEPVPKWTEFILLEKFDTNNIFLIALSSLLFLFQSCSIV